MGQKAKSLLYLADVWMDMKCYADATLLEGGLEFGSGTQIEKRFTVDKETLKGAGWISF